MSSNDVERTVVTKESASGSNPRLAGSGPDPLAPGGPGTQVLLRRIVILVFGLVQLVIGLRFVLLLLDAREANDLVAGILAVSQVFVSPFDGILRTDAINAAGSVFDITAVVALVGWTILEFVVLWAVGLFRRETI